MRFWTLSVLFHLGFFAAFLYLKPDFMRPDLREKTDDDVIVLGFVYEVPVEKDNISNEFIAMNKCIYYFIPFRRIHDKSVNCIP